MKAVLDRLSRERPVVIYGPTASGKSALAMAIAEALGGIVINADASQVFENWRILTARPSRDDEARVPHALYGHKPYDASYSVGTWLREVSPYLAGGARPIIVGGTGLYLTALTEGLAEIPQTPADLRRHGNDLRAGGRLEDMIAVLDDQTRARIDLANPMRVQRAWEVQLSTGRGLASWQADTPAPVLPLARCHALNLISDKHWLEARISRRFAMMLDAGALEEARANAPHWSPDLLSMKAIGARELMAHLSGEMSLDAAHHRATIATRQFAKRQRTWARARFRNWHNLRADEDLSN